MAVVPDAEMLIGDPGTVVAVINVEFIWQYMPETSAVGFPALSKNETVSTKLWPAKIGAGIAAKLLIDAYPGDATIVLLVISEPANETTATMEPFTVTLHGMFTVHEDIAEGVMKI